MSFWNGGPITDANKFEHLNASNTTIPLEVFLTRSNVSDFETSVFVSTNAIKTPLNWEIRRRSALSPFSNIGFEIPWI